MCSLAVPDAAAALAADAQGDQVQVRDGRGGRPSLTPHDNTSQEMENAEAEQDPNAGQDVGFTIRISIPGSEIFNIQVSSMELVQEVHQVLMDREDSCHRTCFSLQLDGVTLDNFAELKSIKGLKEGSMIKVVEEPYTVREARIHVRHVRDLLKSVDNSDAYYGQDCASLSFLNAICNVDTMNKKRGKMESVDCTPPESVMPSAKDTPLLALHPREKDKTKIDCLKILSTSGWNPPPGNRKLRGDLLYIFVVTLEDKRYHITASTRGFYVNQSTEDTFNPLASSPSFMSHSLIDLLSQISIGFKKSFNGLLKRRSQLHPFERVSTPYQVYSWLSPILPHSVDAIRGEDAYSSKLGYEEHIPGQTRDWNEELQTTKELARKSLPERLLRERAMFKVHSDFVAAATRGTVAVIDGNVMAINPGEDPKMQMFIWNNIFFSLGFDVRDHYRELGGDSAAHVAPRNDLQGVKVYNAVDLEGLYTLGTVVLDYRGFRVTAQSIIPGILEREQEQSVVYGSIDFGKNVTTHPKYVDLLQKAGKPLKILPHTVVNEKGEEVLLCSSVECKGIIGNDGRYYILDLLRTFPPDVNFLEIEDIQRSKESLSLGFPIVHNHKLSCLRQELIDSFIEARYMMFIKYAAIQLQQLGLKKHADTPPPKSKESKEEVKDLEVSETTLNKLKEDDAKKIVESLTDSITSNGSRDIEESTKDIIKRAAVAVGSLKDNEFDIRFNPDIYSPGVKHANSEGDAFKRQCALIQDAADFLLTVQVPAFIRDCLEHSFAPLDGPTFSEALHNRGINMRYIGVIAGMLSPMPQLSYLHSIAVSEVVTRAAKHVFRTYLQGLDATVCSGVCHFLNCFFSSSTRPMSSSHADRIQKRRQKRKEKETTENKESVDFAALDSKLLWKLIKKEAKAYFQFDLEADHLEDVCNAFGLTKVSFLRSFCLKAGIQLQLREYFSPSENGPPFAEENIINLFPIVKHCNPRATDAFNFYTTGQTKIQQGFLKDGYELICEALNLLNNVYGSMHPEIAQCLRMLARLNYIMGDHAEALAFQQKAVLMSERVNGIDHPYTITEYKHLSLYSFANNHISTALKLLYRARYLCLVVFGESHPEVALIDSNIGLILHAVGEFDLSLKFLEKALDLNKIFYGKQSLKVAVSYHLVARTQSCMGDFRAALQNEKETFLIYKSQLGEKHEKTRESSECLRHLTQQAVVLQKKMNEMYTGKLKASLPPIQIHSPSMGSVLEMLNIINGILYVQLSQEDVENYKCGLQNCAGELETAAESSPEAGDQLPQVPEVEAL